MMRFPQWYLRPSNPIAVAVISLILRTGPATASAPEEDLTQLSLEQLANVEVTSVSKAGEPLSRAPAAIYVITHEQILRSGATSIPEVLRLAPNLQVRQLTANSYTVTARGFGGNQGDQNFSNKLLMLIDGRSVYTPLFSGIYLDAQDVLLEDVDRIEVISGPGATLWGANAMNGVINIITRPSYLTTGTALTGGAGNQEQNVGVRHGDKLNEETAYRIYGLGFDREALQTTDGASAHDRWWKTQGGFRIDGSYGRDAITLQGDAYRALEQQLGATDVLIAGANLLARWQHSTERSQTQLQTYFDQTQRRAPVGGDAFVLHTYDIQLQQSLSLGSIHRVVWGAGERLNSYGITNAGSLLFLPTHRALTLSNLFAQDTVAVGKSLTLSGGVKLEDDPFAGWAFQPDGRLSWMLNDTAQLWSAASRAIRSPTPFDEDVVEKVGPVVFLTGNRAFRPERVTAYEIGYRSQPASAVSFSISSFYNRYDDLRTIDPASSSVVLPLHWGNAMQGSTYGIEAWANVQVTDWWRLSPGVRTLHKNLSFKAGASGLLGMAQAGDDPTLQASLTSTMDLPGRLTFDTSLRYVDALPEPALPGYYELTARLAWQASQQLQLALVGNNLLQPRHLEYPAPDGEAIPRSVMAQGRWQF